MKKIKIRRSLGNQILSHFLYGTGFAVINEISYRIFNYTQKNDPGLYPIMEKEKSEELERLNEILYQKEEIFNKINGVFHITKTHSRSPEFVKNFLYGGLFGMYFQGLQGVSLFLHTIVGIPLTIFPYYIFCSVFDGKSINGFSAKISQDFWALYLTRFMLDVGILVIMRRSLKKTKNLSKTVSRTLGFRIFYLFSWIFILTSIYNERIQIPNKRKNDGD